MGRATDRFPAEAARAAGALSHVTVVRGPARLPEGWEAVCRRAASGLGVDLEILEAATVPAIVDAIGRAPERSQGVVLHAGAFDGSVTVAAAVARCPLPVVHVDVEELARPGGAVRASALRAIHGRGRRGFAWALRLLAARVGRPAPSILRYGTTSAQIVELRRPEGDAVRPCVVLLHGGFWLHAWERDLVEGLAVDLVDRGWATANVEYRRLGPTGGGWPQTFADVSSALERLGEVAGEHRLDRDRCVLVGHSAGATLALWAATQRADVRRGLAQAPSAAPLTPRGIVSLAGVLDLAAAAVADLGDGAVRSMLTDIAENVGTDVDPVLLASPVARIPLGVPVVAVHGAADEVVPPELTASFVAAAAEAGDDVTWVDVPDDTDHFTVIDPASRAWQATAAAMDRFR